MGTTALEKLDRLAHGGPCGGVPRGDGLSPAEGPQITAARMLATDQSRNVRDTACSSVGPLRRATERVSGSDKWR